MEPLIRSHGSIGAYCIKMNDFTVNEKVLVKKEGPRMNRPGQTFLFLCGQSMFFCKRDILTPYVILSPEAALKFL